MDNSVENIIKINIDLLFEDLLRSEEDKQEYKQESNVIMQIINEQLDVLDPDRANNLLLYIISMISESEFEKNGVQLRPELFWNSIISDLIKKSTNLNLQDKDGKTALMHAFSFDYIMSNDDLIYLIIKKSTNLDLQDKDGKTALIHAFSFDYIMSNDDLISLIIEKSTNLNLQDKDGKTALMHAFNKGFIFNEVVFSNMIEKYQMHGSEDYIKTIKGQILKMKTKLLNANVFVADNEGKTALWYYLNSLFQKSSKKEKLMDSNLLNKLLKVSQENPKTICLLLNILPFNSFNKSGIAIYREVKNLCIVPIDYSKDPSILTSKDELDIKQVYNFTEEEAVDFIKTLLPKLLQHYKNPLPKPEPIYGGVMGGMIGYDPIIPEKVYEKGSGYFSSVIPQKGSGYFSPVIPQKGSGYFSNDTIVNILNKLSTRFEVKDEEIRKAKIESLLKERKKDGLRLSLKKKSNKKKSNKKKSNKRKSNKKKLKN